MRRVEDFGGIAEVSGKFPMSRNAQWQDPLCFASACIIDSFSKRPHVKIAGCE